MTGLLVLLVLAAVYFIPSIVAVQREHRNAWAIVALNVLLGWTFLGWVGALVWSLTAQDSSGEGRGRPTPRGGSGAPG